MTMTPPDVMTLRAGFLIATLALAAISARAQSNPDPLSYFPLQEGNSWTYFETLETPDGSVDTLWQRTFSVSGPVSIDDTLYTLAPHPFAFSDTLRADTTGRIWARIEGEDRLLFDFTREDGEEYPFGVYNGLDYEVTVSTGIDVTVHAGRFADAIELRFDAPEAMDVARTFTFAPDVGIVRIVGSHGEYIQLHSADVAGKTITFYETPDQPATGIDAHAYPNPFHEVTTLVFSGEGPTVVEVYDLLGRKMETLLRGYCTGRCRAHWNAGNVAPGLYFARIRTSSGVQSVPLTAR